MASYQAEPAGKSADFVISRVFDAPRDLVWKAFTEPERMKEWSQGRGPLPVPKVGSAGVPEKLPAGKTSPARTWAAFVISGPGD